MGTRLARCVVILSLLLPVTSQIAPGDAEDKIYKIGDGVSAPKLIHKVQPEYTKRAKKAKIQGVVEFSIIVNRQGQPENIEVTASLDPDLDGEAMRAVAKWRFSPAEKDGVPVAVHAVAEVNFRLCCRW